MTSIATFYRDGVTNASSRKTRVLRRVGLGFVALIAILNLGVTIGLLAQGEWSRALAPAIITLALTVSCVNMIVNFATSEYRRREKEAQEATQTIRIVPSRETTDPHMYAMMRTMETGGPVHLENRDGIWYENGVALPEGTIR